MRKPSNSTYIQDDLQKFTALCSKQWKIREKNEIKKREPASSLGLEKDIFDKHLWSMLSRQTIKLITFIQHTIKTDRKCRLLHNGHSYVSSISECLNCQRRDATLIKSKSIDTLAAINPLFETENKYRMNEQSFSNMY